MWKITPEDDADALLHSSSPPLPSESDMIPHHPMSAKDKKWLSPMTLKDLYDIYLLKTEDGAGRPSYATFMRCYTKVWKKVLGIRRRGQHARCSVCAELDKALRTTQDKDKKAALLAECQEHLRSMLADRDLERSADIGTLIFLNLVG